MENDDYLPTEFKWYDRALTLAKEIGDLEDVSKEFGRPENASLSLFVAMYSYMREQCGEKCYTNRTLLHGIVYELAENSYRYISESRPWISRLEPGYFLAKSFVNEHDRVVRNAVSSLTRRILFFLHGVESGSIISNDIDTVFCEKPTVKKKSKVLDKIMLPKTSRNQTQISIPKSIFLPTTEEVI